MESVEDIIQKVIVFLATHEDATVEWVEDLWTRQLELRQGPNLMYVVDLEPFQCLDANIIMSAIDLKKAKVKVEESRAKSTYWDHILERGSQ